MADESTHSEGTSLPEEPPAGERLDSWKEITAYLKRDIRTLRRWEKEEGLPVHRHVHKKLASVYAYKAELDAWWNNRRPRLEAAEAEEAKEAEQRRKKWLVAAAVAALVALASAGWWLWVRRPTLAFQERDWVLIASFENRTREPVLDGTLEYALERDLNNSRFVNVVPRERIEDTLRLMKKPDDTRITIDLGREVCLRDGGIRALLVGRVEKLGSTYILSARLMNATSGRIVRDFSEEANGQEAILPAMRRLSLAVRASLGEESPHLQESAGQLEKVTTPSLRALQLYSQADPLIGTDLDNVAIAEALLKQAIAEDPVFASAYIHLAWVMRIQGKPEREWRAYSERAVQLASTTTERERYFILGSYYQQTNQNDKALPEYEALLRNYPDHYRGANNLVSVYEALDRSEEALRYSVRRASLRPNDFQANLLAAQAVIYFGNDLAQAKTYLLRALQVATPLQIQQNSLFCEWVQDFSLYESWLSGGVEKLSRELTHLAENKSCGEAEPVGLHWRTWFWYLNLGKLKAAEQLARNRRDLWGQHEGLCNLAFLRDDLQALRENLRTRGATFAVWYQLDCFYHIRAGNLSEAEREIESVEGRSPGLRLKIQRGALARARGQKAQAILLLREGLKETGPVIGMVFLFGSESLAELLEEQGDLEGAREVLENASQKKQIAVFRRSGQFWLRIQVHLARVYRKLGREAEAEQVEAELRKLLAVADPDHPILVELNRAESVAAAPHSSRH